MGNTFTLRKIKFFGLLALIALLMGLFQLTPARAASPEEDMQKANGFIQEAIQAAKAGDVTTAATEYKEYDEYWDKVEDGIKAKSKETYLAVETKMGAVEEVLAAKSVDSKALLETLQALDAEHQNFIKTGGLATESTNKATINSVLGLLDEARNYQAQGEYDKAAQVIKEFQGGWLDVEGEVKTRSVEDYRQTENDMALAANLLSAKNPEAKTVIDRMYTRLEPYKNGSSYGIFDATVIILREGLEALLVIIALLTFLKKSGNQAKQPWVWSGATIGILLSIGLALAIQLIFSSAINGNNREMIEGYTGLIAAAMLIYVSYWMHGKSSTIAWQRYLKQKSTAALAKGSLLGLGLLAFLAIFREGAETVLFFFGMGSQISVGDLVIGIAIGVLALVVLGVLLTVVGLRIPMGPFFAVASLLVFYVCFKFVGTGIHGLQVAGVLSSNSAGLLPENGFFGLYPTWETTIPQAILLVAAIAVVIYGQVRDRRERAIAQKTATSAGAVN